VAEVARPMRLRTLFTSSPLGVVGIFLLGGVYATQSGMGVVFGTQIGLTTSQIALFIAMLFAGALVLQYPIGWISDRMDRRYLVIIVSVIGFAGCIMGMLLGDIFTMLLVSSFIIGGMANPLYSLLIAHTNDFLEHEDMAAASGGLLFINGLGAILGPVITGWMMGTSLGPGGFYLFTAILFAAMIVYAGYRSTVRAALPAQETGSYVPMGPTATSVALEIAQGYAIESELDEAHPTKKTTNTAA